MERFSSINQFRNVVKYARYHNISKMDYIGTVKLHGTNACVGKLKGVDDFVFQSRERELTLTKDNAGFFAWANTKLDVFGSIITMIEYHIDSIKDSIPNYTDDYEKIMVYGEWAGKGILKGCAIHELEKFFYIFQIKVIAKGDAPNFYVPVQVIKDNSDKYSLEDSRIFVSTDFETYDITLDFNSIENIQNELVKFTLDVENKCPVGEYFGVSGIGEGIVFRPKYEKDYCSDLMFKSKGKKHSSSKVKTIAEVDPVMVASIREFVEKTVTDNRISQGIEYLKEMNIDVDIKSTGQFIRWVYNDIIKEESDVITMSLLDAKKVGSYIAHATRPKFLAVLDEIILND